MIHLTRSFGFLMIVLGIFAISGCRKTPKPLLISPNSLDDGVVGKDYEQEFAVAQNSTPLCTALISRGKLPDGLELQFKDKQIKILGKPTTPGDYSFELNVQCYGTNVAGQKVKRTYSLRIKEK